METVPPWDFVAMAATVDEFDYRFQAKKKNIESKVANFEPTMAMI